MEKPPNGCETESLDVNSKSPEQKEQEKIPEHLYRSVSIGELFLIIRDGDVSPGYTGEATGTKAGDTDAGNNKMISYWFGSPTTYLDRSFIIEIDKKSLKNDVEKGEMRWTRTGPDFDPSDPYKDDGIFSISEYYVNERIPKEEINFYKDVSLLKPEEDESNLCYNINTLYFIAHFDVMQKIYRKIWGEDWWDRKLSSRRSISEIAQYLTDEQEAILKALPYFRLLKTVSDLEDLYTSTAYLAIEIAKIELGPDSDDVQFQYGLEPDHMQQDVLAPASYESRNTLQTNWDGADAFHDQEWIYRHDNKARIRIGYIKNISAACNELIEVINDMNTFEDLRDKENKFIGKI